MAKMVSWPVVVAWPSVTTPSRSFLAAVRKISRYCGTSAW